MHEKSALWEKAGMGTMRLGEVLVANEVISTHQLREVLERHPSSARMMGELLMDMGAVTEDQLATALDTQDQMGAHPGWPPYF